MRRASRRCWPSHPRASRRSAPPCPSGGARRPSCTSVPRTRSGPRRIARRSGGSSAPLASSGSSTTFRSRSAWRCSTRSSTRMSSAPGWTNGRRPWRTHRGSPSAGSTSRSKRSRPIGARGLATACARALIERHSQAGLHPVWGAVESNLPSRALAACLGFQPAGTGNGVRRLARDRRGRSRVRRHLIDRARAADSRLGRPCR